MYIASLKQFHATSMLYVYHGILKIFNYQLHHALAFEGICFFFIPDNNRHCHVNFASRYNISHVFKS